MYHKQPGFFIAHVGIPKVGMSSVSGSETAHDSSKQGCFFLLLLRNPAIFSEKNMKTHELGTFHFVMELFFLIKQKTLGEPPAFQKDALHKNSDSSNRTPSAKKNGRKRIL